MNAKKQKTGAPNDSSDEWDFAEAFANRAAHRLGLDARWGAERKSRIAEEIAAHWKTWRVKLLPYADDGSRDCYFQFPFKRTTHYTPTLQDVLDNLPAEMKAMHDAKQLTVRQTDIGYNCHFQYRFDLTKLVHQKVEQMKATEQWPTATAEDKKRLCEKWIESDDDHELECSQVKALKAAGWTMKANPHRYVKGENACHQWPEGVEEVKYEHPVRMSVRVEHEMKKLEHLENEKAATRAGAGGGGAPAPVKIEIE